MSTCVQHASARFGRVECRSGRRCVGGRWVVGVGVGDGRSWRWTALMPPSGGWRLPWSATATHQAGNGRQASSPSGWPMGIPG